MFKCECGKEFENGQSFNGHKSNCRVHYASKYGSTDKLAQRNLLKNQKAGKTRTRLASIKHELLANAWNTESHYCAKCGQLIQQKFGSGKFCSRACANAREHSIETKQKIARAVHKYIEANSVCNGHKPEEHFCVICGHILNKYNKTGFCNNCLHKTPEGKHLYSKITGGLRVGAGYGKGGWYRGHYCDSTYELVYLIYCLDHNISVSKNTTKYFYYWYNGKQHKYYPDFIVEDGFVEIKGYHTDLVDIKLAAVPDGKIKIYYKKDLEEMFSYVATNYSYSKLTDLYD